MPSAINLPEPEILEDLAVPAHAEPEIAAFVEQRIPALIKSIEICHIVGMDGGRRNPGEIERLTLAASHSGPFAILTFLQTGIWRDVLLLVLHAAWRNHNTTSLVQEGRTKGRVMSPGAIHRFRGLVFQML